MIDTDTNRNFTDLAQKNSSNKCRLIIESSLFFCFKLFKILKPCVFCRFKVDFESQIFNVVFWAPLLYVSQWNIVYNNILPSKHT